ncbi:MAG TPA: DinB family protein [Gemmataceae bacterium]|nr:DinB family protein [Gemmataceae bacterium]
MDLLSYLRRSFAYNAWANQETLASLKQVEALPPKALGRLGHLVGAEYLWLSRLDSARKRLAVWPELTLAECQAEFAALGQEWQSYLNKLTAPQLSEQIRYTNSKGEPWTSRVEDVLTHVLLHAAYHRGQIAADLGGSGHTPAYTDFIHCVRQGIID